MSDTIDQRFAPPQAHVADLASTETVLAGRGTRLLAAVVDGLIVAGALMALGLIPALQPVFQSRQGTEAYTSLSPLAAALGFAVFLLIQGWPLLTRGQTLGKMLFKLRIVRSDGAKPDAWRLLGLRYGIGIVLNMNVMASMVYGLVDCLLIFRESRKCLHDSIADTKVIKL